MSEIDYKWNCFLDAADEFLIAYAKISLGATVPIQLFIIGHAVELYLKAANAKITGDVNKSVKFGHNLYGLWKACKTDSTFMPNFEIRESLFKIPFYEEDIYKKCSEEESTHFIENNNLYTIMKHQMDLKYGGAPFKTIKGGYMMLCLCHNPYWIKFFKEIRKFLKYPSENNADHIKFQIQNGYLTNEAKNYLEQLYHECPLK